MRIIARIRLWWAWRAECRRFRKWFHDRLFKQEYKEKLINPFEKACNAENKD